MEDINKGKWYSKSDNVWLDKMNHCIVGEKYRFWKGNEEIIVTRISINRGKFLNPHNEEGWYATVTFDYTDKNRRSSYNGDRNEGHITGIEHFWNGSWGTLRNRNLDKLITN